jgi:hypothetical protein
MSTPHEEEDLNGQIHKVDSRYRSAITVILAVMGACILVLIAAVIWLSVVVLGNTAQNARQIAVNQAASDHRWCATIDLLTETPVPKPADPAANPSREANYQLYLNFLVLKDQFGCRP